MGTVGINFGSATGGAGFDVATTVTSILSAQKSIENPWNDQLTALKAQDTALSTIGTDLASFSTALQSLTDFSGVTAQKNGSSSNTNLIALTGATSAASAGSHTVVINNLASTSSQYTDPVAAADVLAGSITIKVGPSGTSHTITVDSASNTLSTLASAINGAAIGVSASVITDTTGSRLSLVSGTGGTAGALTVTSALTDTSTTPSSAVAAHTGAPATDASLTVDGVGITSGTNTVSTAIPGVTFQLLATPATVGTQVQIQITNDTASVATAVGTLVSAYNAVAKDLKTQEGKDATGAAEPLYGSPTLALIQTQLSSAINAGNASGSISSVTQFGITFNNDGTLALNTDSLTSALTNHFSDIVGFLQNANSFGHGLTAALNGLSSTATYGALHVAEAQNASQEAALKTSISNEDALLATQKITLTNELNTANQILQSIPDQLTQINEIYSAVTGYNTKG